MFSNINKNKQHQSNEKKGFSFLNKHSRSHSANSANTSDNNISNRGWLESNGVQVSPSRSSEINPITPVNNLRKPIIYDTSKKDMLGDVSPEDILHLTEVTSRLSDRSSNSKKQNRNSINIKKQGSNTQPKKENKSEQQQQQQQHQPITSPKSDDNIPDPVISDEGSKRKWFNKSKKNSGGSSSKKSNESNDNSLSRNDSMNSNPSSDKPKRHGRSRTSDFTYPEENLVLEPEKRRHSFDSSINNLIGSDDEELKKWDEDRKKNSLELYSDTDEIQVEEDNASVKAIIEDKNTPLAEVEEMITIMFDYFSLPKEIKELLDIYEHKGKVERKKMTVKYKKSKKQEDTSSSIQLSIDDDEYEEEDLYDDDDEDDDDEEDDEDDEDEFDDTTTVLYQDLIIGGHDKVNYKLNPIRDIAFLTTTISDNIEFTKLIQLNSTDQGPLLDLHVSMFADDKYDIENIDIEEEISDMLHDVESKLYSVKKFRKESDLYLQEQLEELKSLNLIQDIKYKRPGQSSHSYSQYLSDDGLEKLSSSISSFNSTLSSETSSSSTSSGSGIILTPTKDPQDHHNPENKKQKDPFIHKQEEIERLVRILKSELGKFKSTLQSTEELVSDVQLDLDDFRNRMETYIKDIPESHYSALKKLELDIEDILSKRAKNPWLDTGYALLSYLLTLFALLVWILIYILKLGKKIVLFPHKLWKDYSEYLVERNKMVKKASMRSVSGHSLATMNQMPPPQAEQIIMKPTSSLFQRRSNFYPKNV